METPEAILGKLKAILLKAKEEKTFYLGTVLAAEGIHKDTWASWRTIYTTHDGITDLMKLIELTLESKLVEKALSGDTNVTVSVLALRNLYGWSDKKGTASPRPLPIMPELPFIRFSNGVEIEI